MRKEQNRYWCYDTAIMVRTEKLSDPGAYRAVLNALRRHGFRVRQDPSASRLIRHDYHIGERGDLRFHSRCFPTGCEINFYQEIVTKNPNGGKYDFDKKEKMPYLIRQRFLWEKRYLERVLAKRGFIDTTKPEPRTAAEKVEIERQLLRDFQGQDFYDKPVERYNAEDADGCLLKDGDFRYFYGYDGRLGRGTVYHHINNMWWVIVNPTTVRNIASFRLFTYDQTKHPYSTRVVENPRARIEAKLKQAVKEENFERAIGLRDALRRTEAVQAV